MIGFRVVVFEMVAEAALCVEGAVAQIAEDVVLGSVIPMVLQAVEVFERPDTFVAVVVVAGSLFDVVL